MGKFIREYWIWIAVPFVLVTAVIVWMLCSDSGESVTPFSYPIY